MSKQQAVQPSVYSLTEADRQRVALWALCGGGGKPRIRSKVVSWSTDIRYGRRQLFRRFNRAFRRGKLLPAIGTLAEARHQFSVHRLISHRQRELDKLLKVWRRRGFGDAKIRRLIDEAVDLGVLNP